MDLGEWGGREPTKWDWLAAMALATLWVALIRPGPLSLPYFWDEADVYVPGAQWLARHGLDLRPGVFPDDWSRGHPPLLYLLAGVAFRLFGPAPTVGHLVVLPFTALALAGTYLLGATLFGRRAGGAAALLLGCTPLFMAIGNMLLPEVPLTAVTVLALYCLARGRLIPAVALGSGAVLLKETGVFTALAITGALLWDAWRTQTLRDQRTWMRLAISLVPVAVLCGFFLWQKLLAGYFIYPHHQNLLWDRPLGWRDLGTVWPSLLFWHGRWVVIAAALLWVAILAALKSLPGAAPPPPGTERWRPTFSTSVVAILLLVAANAVFFVKMFWLERYALPAHPGIVVLACGALLGGLTLTKSPWDRRGPVFRWAAVGAAVLVGFFALRSRSGPDRAEHTFAYADVIETHRDAFRGITRRGGKNPTVLTSWPMTVELRRPWLGYVDRSVRTIHIDYLSSQPRARIDLILVAARSSHAPKLRREAQLRGMKLVKAFRRGKAQTLELYAP
ncbi:MAG: glycosyltransferase family 39 protein [bacterium]